MKLITALLIRHGVASTPLTLESGENSGKSKRWFLKELPSLRGCRV